MQHAESFRDLVVFQKTRAVIRWFFELSRQFSIIGLLLVGCLNASADYIAGRRAATELGRTGKHLEAMFAFSNLVSEAKSDVQRSDALEQAAFWAGNLKRHAEAMAFAEQIPLPATRKNCRMKILRNTGRHEELIAEFKDEKIAEWPESQVGEGRFSRGAAYAALKDGASAAADLQAAVDYMADPLRKAAALSALGDNYRSNLQDDAKALDAYGRIVAMNMGYYATALSAVLSSVNILKKQGAYDEAFKMLDGVDTSTMGGYWLGALLAARAELFASQGRSSEAIAKMTEAATVQGMPASQQASYEKRLKELQAAQGEQ